MAEPERQHQPILREISRRPSALREFPRYPGSFDPEGSEVEIPAPNLDSGANPAPAPRSSSKESAPAAAPSPSDDHLQEQLPLPDLRRAVTRILHRWREGSGQENPGREAELTHALVCVAEDVVCAGRGDVPEPPEDGLVLRRRLLDLLRSELVAVWAEVAGIRPEADEMTGALQALERVREVYAPAWDDEFGVDLQGPDGLELAVEVAHDFRSPLSSILFLADTLREGGSGELNDLQRRQLSLIYGAALSMVAMASDVVDLGRDGYRAGQREPNQFSIAEVMDSVQGIVEPMAAAKGLSVVVRPPKNDIRQGDVEALRRVLLNLVTNAVKFTSEGFVELSARSLGPVEVEFSVRDTGPGIRKGAQSNLYQTFRPFQGRSGFHFSGTGLGLSIARKLVESMDGTLEFDTKTNLGTRFHFTIDLQPVGLI
jgi:signal transduction histidine kinase